MSVPWMILGLAAVVACSKSTDAGSGGAAPSPTRETEADAGARQALAQLEAEWATALVSHDTTFFARVVATDFQGTQDSGKTFGRADVIKDAADTATQVRDLHDEDQQIRILGDGTVGVVTGRSLWTVEKGEHPGAYSGRYTETWVHRDGQWQVVAGHYSIVPPASQP
jgi:uncharacterized protein (TIGR02246 family)